MKGLVLIIAFVLLMPASLGGEASLADVRFEQRLGVSLPLSAKFIDADGNPRELRDVVGRKPTVLFFGYARCPQLCQIVADGTVEALRRLRWSVGREFAVVAISIDSTETVADARARRQQAVRSYGRGESVHGWNYFVGAESDIRAVAIAAGFHYAFDAASRQYAHPSGFIVVTPAGVVSRYFLGVDFRESEIASSLARAREGKTGESVFDLTLRCFRGDGAGGRYGRIIWGVLASGVALTVVGLSVGIGWMLRQERRGTVAREGAQ